MNTNAWDTESDSYTTSAIVATNQKHDKEKRELGDIYCLKEGMIDK